MNEDKIKSEDPGKSLRQAREKSGLSINDVSVATKINPRILKALEEGNKEALPAHSFARGFIRSYAAYLKIEAQPILDAFDLTQGTAAPHINTDADATESTISPVSSPSASADVKKPSPASKRSMTLPSSALASKGVLVASLLVTLGLVFAIKAVIDKYAQERVIETGIELPATPGAITEPNGNTESSKATSDAPSTSQATDAKESSSEVKNSTVTDDNKTSATATAAPATPSAAPSAPSSPTAASGGPTATPPSTASSATPSPNPVAEKPALATEAAKPTTLQPQEVIIEALDGVEFTVRIDGGSSQKISLKPESVHTIKAKSEIQLDIKDGGTVNIVHNGRDRGVPGDLGKPIKLKFP